MHNIKEGHDVKASVGHAFVDYVEAFKKTKRANFLFFLMKIQNAGKRNYQIP